MMRSDGDRLQALAGFPVHFSQFDIPKGLLSLLPQLLTRMLCELMKLLVAEGLRISLDPQDRPRSCSTSQA
jgi:hypothetical protein